MCENTVAYYVPKGYDYKEVFGKCGNTGYDGERLVCYDCSNDPRKMAEIERQERNIAASTRMPFYLIR
jgi:hypothetical protein